MAINWEKEYGQKETSTKKSKINWDKEYNPVGYQKNIDTQRQDRISKGLPVSANKEKVAPSLAGSIIRTPLKLGADVLTNIARAGQVVVGKEPTADLSNNYLGKVEGLGEIDVTKGLTPQNIKTVKKSVATGAEIASYLGYGGVTKKAVTTGIAKKASEKTFSEIVKATTPKLLKEGALTGLSGSLGSQGRENADKGTPISATQTLQDVALSTVLTPLASLGLTKLGKMATGADKEIIGARKAIRDASNAEVLGRPIPPVTGPLDTIKAKSKITDTIPFNPNAVVDKPNINIEQGARWTTPKVKPTNGFELRATKSATKQDFINSEVGFLTRTKQQPTSSLMKTINKAWDNMHPAPIQETTPKIPKTSTKPNITQQAEIPTSNTAQPKVDTSTPEFTAKVTEGTEVLNNARAEAMDKGSHKVYSETVYNDLMKDPERVKRIALGSGEQTTNNVPVDAYYAIAKNEAAKSGDIKLMKELANSDVSTISGQRLESNKLTQEGDVVDTIREIQKVRQKTIGLSDSAFERQSKELVAKLKQSLSEFSLPTKQEVDDIINSLICK